MALERAWKRLNDAIIYEAMGLYIDEIEELSCRLVARAESLKSLCDEARRKN